MENLKHYLHIAWRAIVKDKWLSALMVLALAVGIGACITTSTVYHVLSGDPLPGRSENLYYVQSDGDPRHAESSAPWDLLDYRSAKDLSNALPVGHFAMVASAAASVERADQRAQPLEGHFLATNAGFFTMFSPPLMFGRAWSLDDEARSAHVAVLSYDANERLFNGRNSIGKDIQMDGTSYRIVGVLGPWRPHPLFYEVAGGSLMRDSAATFFGTVEDVLVPFSTAVERHVNLFNPWYCWQQPSEGQTITESRGCLWVQLWVWLDSPAAREEFERHLAGYAADQRLLGRFDVTPKTRLISLMGWLSYNGVVPDAVRLQLGMAYCFLLVCLCNAIGLLFAKFAGREQEFALRRALGATRSAIFVQCLTEAILVALLGGIGGALLSFIGLSGIRSQPFSYSDLAHIDFPMLAFLSAISVLCGCLVAFVPAWRAATVAPAAHLRGGAD